jgi:signal transduction histidine kinase
VHEGQWAIIETADTGVGISDDDMDKLFDAFFSSKSTGSGLGLTVSAQIINNHGGAIEVQKREPKGTIFKIKLPLRPLSEKSTLLNSNSPGLIDSQDS